jgi:hypothetical protein
MKRLLTLLILLTSITINAQLPYQKDKKWGLSKNGTGDEKDSIIVRAAYDKIEYVGEVIYAGLRNDEWQFLTSNKLVNQQSYEKVEVPHFTDGMIAVGTRAGYIDLVDVQQSEFIVRSVQADKIINTMDYFMQTENLLMTQKDDFFGLINKELKKETLKAKYTKITENQGDDVKAYPVLAFADGKNSVCSLEGKVLHEFQTNDPVIAFSKFSGIDNCFSLEVSGKKGSSFGMFDATNKWVIPPLYIECWSLDNTSDAIVVQGVKGVGLYFQGKMMLDCKYLEIIKSEKRGFICKVIGKKGEYYLTPEGKLEIVED